MILDQRPTTQRTGVVLVEANRLEFLSQDPVGSFRESKPHRRKKQCWEYKTHQPHGCRGTLFIKTRYDPGDCEKP
jgi:hypothetical protein